MKKQECIVKIYDKKGRFIDFERFTLKSVSGILNSYRRIADENRLSDGSFTGLWGYFFRKYIGAGQVVIYRMPDARTEEMLASYTGEEFLKAIGIN